VDGGRRVSSSSVYGVDIPIQTFRFRAAQQRIAIRHRLMDFLPLHALRILGRPRKGGPQSSKTRSRYVTHYQVCEGRGTGSLEFLETEVPAPGPTKVRIKVKTNGINYSSRPSKMKGAMP
jgi:hypothetical protein